MKHIDLGDIVVTPYGAPSPYKDGISGVARAAAFSSLFAGNPEKGYTYWHAPSSGGARRINPKSAPALSTINRSGDVVVIGDYVKKENK